MSTYNLTVTSCTARKRGGHLPVRLSSELVGKDLEATAKQWRAAVAAHAPRLLARDLYGGRSMVDAKFVADTLDAPLYVASAGLGLVAGNEQVAPYDLTASGSHGGLQDALLRFNATSMQWWDLLCDGRGLAFLLAQHPRAILLASLPANYVEMVVHELLQLSPETTQRVRLFTSQPGINALPARLAHIAMPYDDRLESIPKCAGTRADFPQRAMRHFVECLNANLLSQHQARVAVRDALSPHQPPRQIKRGRADDETIKNLIREQWSDAGGRGGILLRHLRDEALISCEQGRFAQLWREVRDELAHSKHTAALK